jgi:hypothetical protein
MLNVGFLRLPGLWVGDVSRWFMAPQTWHLILNTIARPTVSSFNILLNDYNEMKFSS